MASAIATITKAKELADAALGEYYEACERYDWARCEEIRFRALAHMESYVDLIAAAYKRLQVAQP